MNSKHLLCLSIAAALSANAMAFEIQKGKVISQKQWATDGAVALFSAKNKPSLPMLNIGKAARSENASFNVTFNITANVSPLDATVGNPVDIYTYNNVFILNLSDNTNNYRIDFDICVEMPDHLTRCAFGYRNISLDSSGSFSDYDSPGLQPTFDKPGRYKVRTSATLAAENGPIIGEAVSEAVITVS
jgi:hypothetical protein